WAITDLDKRVENRTWKPPLDVQGERIALHASKSYDSDGHGTCATLARQNIPIAALPSGAIVATALVAGWLHLLPDEGPQRNVIARPAELKRYVDDRWFFGPVGWILDDVRKLPEPIPCSGALGLWRVPDDIVKQIEETVTS
ncbi:MAG: hypothetical protein ACOC8X_11710, partial [Chloroflexota bacterium]